MKKIKKVVFFLLLDFGPLRLLGALFFCNNIALFDVWDEETDSGVLVDCVCNSESKVASKSRQIFIIRSLVVCASHQNEFFFSSYFSCRDVRRQTAQSIVLAASYFRGANKHK